MQAQREWRECPAELIERLRAPLPESAFESLLNFDDVPSNGDALLLVGPAGAGKTHWFHRTQPPFALIDGDRCRALHPGWQQAIQNPTIGYTSAHSYMKGPVKDAKRRWLHEALRQRRNVCLPLTFSTEANWDDVQRVVEANYRIQVIGLVVDVDTMVARTTQRARDEGRLQEPTSAKWKLCLEGLVALLQKYPTTGRVFDSTREDLPLLYDGPEDFEEFK